MVVSLFSQADWHLNCFTHVQSLFLSFFSERHHMDHAATPKTEKNEDTPVEIKELIQAVESLPPEYKDRIAPSLVRVVECSSRRRRILNLVQEALAQLRLDMKYLVFDLEATRRERDIYKEQIEDLNQED